MPLHTAPSYAVALHPPLSASRFPQPPASPIQPVPTRFLTRAPSTTTTLTRNNGFSRPSLQTDKTHFPPHDTNRTLTPNGRCTPPWSSCLQGHHAFLQLQHPKVRSAPAHPTSEPSFPVGCLPEQFPHSLYQWFVAFTVLIMLSLAFLGLTNVVHVFPLNDKLLHFFCLGIATGVFYFIFDVEEWAEFYPILL